MDAMNPAVFSHRHGVQTCLKVVDQQVITFLKLSVSKSYNVQQKILTYMEECFQYRKFEMAKGTRRGSL